MAFTTGPDFLSGILGASNSTDVLNRFRSDTGQEDFYQGLQGDRYGERIGDDGYLIDGVFTTDSIDTDRDGIDDRHQAGPGQPKIGVNPDSPIFGGGGGNPPPGGGGGSGGDNPNSPANSSRPVSYGTYDSPESYAAQFGNLDSYDPERSLYADYVPSNMGPSTTPFGMTYGETAPDLFETGYDLYNMVPSFGKLATSLASSAYDKFIDPADQAIAERLGLTGSYDEQQEAAEDFTQSNISKKEAIASDLEAQNADMLSQLIDMAIDDGYSPGFGSDPLSDLSDYTVAELENQALGINMNMTNQYNNAINKRKQNAIVKHEKHKQSKTELMQR